MADNSAICTSGFVDVFTCYVPVDQNQAQCYVLSSLPGVSTSQIYYNVMFGRVRQMAAPALKLLSTVVG